MNALTAFRSALRALSANALRSVLTMLGIIIGVAAVIAMIAVGQGATQRVQEQMKGLGSNIMLVLPGGVSQAGVRLGAQTRQRLTEEDAQAQALLKQAKAYLGDYKIDEGWKSYHTARRMEIFGMNKHERLSLAK